MTARPGPRLAIPAVGLAVAVICGAAAMALIGAPPHYAPVNLAALALGLAVCAIAVRSDRPKSWRALVWIAPLGLALATFAGFEIDGVRRWLGHPPVAIHAGMLFLPTFGVLAARRFDTAALAASSAVALLLALQPDRGTALAFLCVMAMVAWQHRTPSALLAVCFAALALMATVIQSDPLAPVPFVEGVLQETLQSSPLIGSLLTLALAGAILAAAVLGYEGAPLAAFFGALALASLLGAYPTPLIGYGAAPILGFALALAVMSAISRADEHTFLPSRERYGDLGSRSGP